MTTNPKLLFFILLISLLSYNCEIHDLEVEYDMSNFSERYFLKRIADQYTSGNLDFLSF